jgi:large subunit ribosomal protein L19e
MEEISEAVTRGDVRSLISSKIIKKKQKKGVSSGRAKHRAEQKRKGRRKGHGKRKGAKGARTPKKERWMKTIRALRSQLRELKTEAKIDSTIYRKYYRKANGGMFKSRAHLMAHMKAEGAFEEKKDTPQIRFGVPSKKVVRKVVRRKKVVKGVV